MPFPNHRGKYDSDPLVTPERSADYSQVDGEGDRPDAPRAVVLCYSRGLMDHLTGAYPGVEVDRYYGDLYLFEDTDRTVGVLGNFGIGAPTTAMLVEELVRDGVEAFLSVGFAGCLAESIDTGAVVVCERAIRDEGTSHHYIESGTDAYPSESLVETAKQRLRTRGDRFHAGPSWTTDAIYRETRAEVERYAEEGVLTVEMEASAVFTVADYRGADAGAMFVVSDHLGPSGWEPAFHETEGELHRLGDIAKEALTTHVG